MDALLASLGVQAMNYAIRSGIALTSSYAIQQCSRLLKTVDDRGVHSELKALQKLLDSKIKIISPAVDLIEFKSGRGNVFLESAVPLAKSLHRDIVSLGRRLENAAAEEEGTRNSGKTEESEQDAEKHRAELRRILSDINSLLVRIDRDIPLIQLAITASGESLSTSLPPGVSPSRLLQASTFLIVGDTQFANDPGRPVQIGPSFTLSLYMLFVGHSSRSGRTSARTQDVPKTPTQEPRHQIPQPQEEPYGWREGERKPIWQEVIHKARVRLCRTPLHWTFDPELGYCPVMAQCPDHDAQTDAHVMPFPEHSDSSAGRPDEYSYHLEIIEDLDDGRLHDEDGLAPSPFDDIPKAGIRESIPVHQISKIFYTDTGRILNIGTSADGDNNPVLLLKRDVGAPLPSRPMQSDVGNESPGVSVTGLRLAGDEVSTSSVSREPDDQADIDRQLQQESASSSRSITKQPAPEPWARWDLPRHVDPEWLALEIYTEDDDGIEDDEDEDSTHSDENVGTSSNLLSAVKPGAIRDRSSIDSKLLAQIHNISLRQPATTPPTPLSHPTPGGLEKGARGESSPESFVSRSPFGAITSSLSLMEMLIRLTSLQEFQQMTHLAIPDHILTFFLEETSTTGLRGEERWKARNEAKRRVGFDPYTDDTPTK